MAVSRKVCSGSKTSNEADALEISPRFAAGGLLEAFFNCENGRKVYSRLMNNRYKVYLTVELLRPKIYAFFAA